MSATLEPFLSFKGKKITAFGKPPNPSRKPLSEGEKLLLSKKENPYSLFSQKSRARLMKSLNAYCDTITLGRSLLKIKSLKPLKHHTFTTLTLSATQRHCDKVIKRELLNDFLQQLKRRYGTKHYIWKAEVQSNGNLHFHILTESFIPHEELRALWNQIQDKLDYVRLSNNWQKNPNPNSTDIHSLRKINDVVAYTGKYMAKDETVRPICGHTWGRSDLIAKLQPITLYESCELAQWFEMQRNSIEHKVFNSDWSCTYVFSKVVNWNTLPKESLERLKSIVASNVMILNVPR